MSSLFPKAGFLLQEQLQEHKIQERTNEIQ